MNPDLTFSSNRRNSEAHALREVREQLKKDLLRYQGNQVGTYEFVGRRARGNKVIVNRVGMKGGEGI